MLFVVVGVGTERTELLLWAAGVAGLAVAAILWSRAAWRGVDVHAEFRPARVFTGEPVWLRVRVRNAKRLPLPVVNVRAWLPPGLMPGDASGPATIRGFHRRMSIPGGAEVVLELPVRVLRRGEYWLERVVVEVADPFHLAPMERLSKPQAALVVFPEPRIQIPVEIMRRLPFGAPARAARVFEERERFAGVRPYEAGDPLNRIHWRLTGHSGALQTKLFEPTRTPDAMLVLDLSVGEPFWDAIYPEIAEDTIGWASFIARRAVDSGWRVGLVANTHLTRGRGPLRVPAGRGGDHEAALFLALARMPNEPTSDLAPLLREVGRLAQRDTTVVLISPRPGPRLRQDVVALRRRGVEVVELSPLEAVLTEAG